MLELRHAVGMMTMMHDRWQVSIQPAWRRRAVAIALLLLASRLDISLGVWQCALLGCARDDVQMQIAIVTDMSCGVLLRVGT